MKSGKKNEVKPISSFLEDEFNSGNSNILIRFFSIHQIFSKIKNLSGNFLNNVYQTYHVRLKNEPTNLIRD